MNPQETKFSFVYNEIKRRILEGQIPPGSVLPSSRMCCEQFHVSRYTINRVFDALRSEGLVDIQPRLAPVVASKEVDDTSSNAVFEILEQKDGILQLYQTFALIMPSIWVFALRGCEIEMMPHYRQAMKSLRLGYTPNGWYSISKLGYDVLRIGGNSLFSELYSTFGLYNKLAFFSEDCPCFAECFLQGPVSVTGLITEILKGGNAHTRYNHLSSVYQNLTESIERTLNRLSETAPQGLPQADWKFAWNPRRGQDYYYARIVDNLNLKIGLGEYAVGMCLPSEKQLANQYHVSLATVRKALSELEQRGFVKTLNGKGTIVIEPDNTRLRQLSLNSGYTERALRYLHALQLMVLIIRPAALISAPRFTRAELDELADKFASPGSIHLIHILESILKHIPLEPLYVILSETSRLLEWGHHFVYYPSRRHTLSHLNEKAAWALQQLTQGNVSAFADGIADCYRYNLIRIKKQMLEKYKFHIAANIRIPEKY